jgi:hypothetical protein
VTLCVAAECVHEGEAKFVCAKDFALSLAIRASNHRGFGPEARGGTAGPCPENIPKKYLT